MNRLQHFMPPPPPMHPAEAARVCAGAFLGIALTGLVSMVWLGSTPGLPLLMAPLGASAILLFGVPASPLAQPWSIIGGNLVAAFVGVTMARWLAAPAASFLLAQLLVAAMAMACSLAVMLLLRCVHPPSGAVALTAVLGGPHVTGLGYEFVLLPVGLNSVLLTTVALLYNNATGHSYPHRAHAPLHPHPPATPLSLDPGALDEVLADYGDTLDITRDDLAALFQELVGRAQNSPARVHEPEPILR